jgi:hypothetical protein
VRRALSLLVVLGAAALVAVLVNVVLLMSTASGNDPVGKLSPRAGLPAPPPRVIRPYTGTVEHDDSDD